MYVLRVEVKDLTISLQASSTIDAGKGAHTQKKAVFHEIPLVSLSHIYHNIIY